MSIVPFPELDWFARYGYLGVQLFFMISGFVIFMSAENRSPRDFAFSRALRLYPAFWLCCTLTFLIVWLFAREISMSFSEFLINLTMLAEFFDVSSVDGAYWSLYVEINFYLLVYLMLLFKKSHQLERALQIWLVLSIISYSLPIGGSLGTVLRLNYAPYFVAGGTFYLVYSKGSSLMRIAAILASFGTALLYSLRDLSGLVRHYKTDFSGSVVFLLLLVFFSTFALIAWRKTDFVKSKKYLYMGMITYPLYLLHQRIGFIMLNQLYLSVDRFILLAIVIAVLVGAALFVAKYFEKPVIRLVKQKFSRFF